MDAGYINELIDRLRRWGHSITAGLSDAEVSSIEARFSFHFPPDLRGFLQQALPVSGAWVDWRNGSTEEIQRGLAWPLDGIIFDIEHNAFWLESWGLRPALLADAIEVARTEVAKVPTLIPIFSHRYMPDEPPHAGNPVFSVYQRDIIYYGYDLASYLGNEFSEGQEGRPVGGIYQPDVFREQPRPIRFWDEIVG